MQSVIAEFEQGSRWDSGMLVAGFLFVVAAFASTYETAFWEFSDDLLLPLLTAGASLVILNIVLRIVRPKLKVTLFEIQGDLLKISPVRNLQFSGWVATKPVTVNIADVSSVKAYNFYNPGNKAGMYWIGVELPDRRVIELNTDNQDTVSEVISFFEEALPDVVVTVDARIEKAQR